MSIAYKLAEVVSKPAPPPRNFTDIGPECFAAVDHEGATHIAWKGEWYSATKMTWRVRLHNWLIGIGNRHNADISPS